MGSRCTCHCDPVLRERAKGTLFVALDPIPPTHLNWTRTKTNTNVDQSAASPEDLEEGHRAPESALFAELSHREWKPYVPLGICSHHEEAEESRSTEKSGNGGHRSREALSQTVEAPQFPVAGGRPGCTLFLRLF